MPKINYKTHVGVAIGQVADGSTCHVLHAYIVLERRQRSAYLDKVKARKKKKSTDKLKPATQPRQNTNKMVTGSILYIR